jgi:ATP-binding cassette subfamily C (CFTR/MRP) protein 1
MRLPSFRLRPEPPTHRCEEVLPKETANILEKLTFGWIFPVLRVSTPFLITSTEPADVSRHQTGYSRTLEEEDVWCLHEAQKCQNVSEALERQFYSRCPPRMRPQHSQTDEIMKEISQDEKSGDMRLASWAELTEKKSIATSGKTVSDVDSKGTAGLSEKANTRKIVTDSSSLTTDVREKQTGEPTSAVYTRQPLQSVSSSPPPKRKVGNMAYSFSKLWRWKAVRRKSQVTQGTLLHEADEDGAYQYYDTSLTLALFWTTWRQLFLALVLASADAVMLTTSSLVTKRLITYVTTRHDWSKLQKTQRIGLPEPKSIAYGVGLAIGLAAMRLASAFFFNHSFAQVSDCGLMMRSAVIDQIARKSLRLSLRSRTQHTNGKQISGVVTDSTYVESAFSPVVQAIVDPLTIIIGFVLLILNLGPSALVVSPFEITYTGFLPSYSRN